MATAQMQKIKQKTGKWSTVFPVEQVTEQQSALFVKKLLAVAISNITYLRTVFPEHAFGDRCLEDLNLKILRDDSACPGACQVIQWVKACFDALEKKYLKMIIMALYKDEKNPKSIVESYTFKFSYDGDGISIYRNGEKITGANNAAETRKATIKLLRTIVVLTQTLKPLPDNVLMTMKLLYYDDVTPMDYEPPGFEATNEDFNFTGDPMAIRVGDVQTPFHEVKLRVNTECQQFVVEEEKKDKCMEIDDHQLTPCGEAVEPKQQAAESEHVHIKEELNNTLGTEEQEDDDDSDTIARCPCGYNEDEGLMILCGICDEWQHATCFGIINESNVPELHVCEACADGDKYQCTDPELLKLSPMKLQAHCLWRRTLVSLTEMNKVLPHILARRMSIDVTVAQGLMNRLEKEGFVKTPVKGKGRSHYKTVQKDFIRQMGFSKYFLSSGPSCQEDDKETIHSSINHLTQKTSSMTIKPHDQKAQISLRDTPLLNEARIPVHQSSAHVANGGPKSNPKKRARVNETNIEFEIADSQEPNYEDNIDKQKRKRRKSSIASRSIVV